MSATDYADLSRHIGHKVEVVTYADINVAIECEECSEVLMDFDQVEQTSDTDCNCAELDDDLIEAGNTCYNCYATNKDVSRLEN